MERFFDEVVDREPFRVHYDALMVAYEKILAHELAPHAFDLALALMQLEDAFPAITRLREEER